MYFGAIEADEARKHGRLELAASWPLQPDEPATRLRAEPAGGTLDVLPRGVATLAGLQ